MDIESNTCLLNKLTCPVHSHANTANDQCLKDAPLACPQGQHDDGSYTCVADTPIACNQITSYSGSINGIPQCIPKQNINEKTAAADIARNDAQAAATQAQAASDALAADPTNATKQQAYNIAAGNLATKNSQAGLAAQEAQTELLKNIDDTLKNQDDTTPNKSATSGGSACSAPPSCSGDVIACAQLAQQHALTCKGDDATQGIADSALGGHTTLDENNTTLASFDYTGLGVDGTCPVPRSYSLGSTLGSFTIDVSPFCSLAVIIGNLIMLTASFVSLRILTSST